MTVATIFILTIHCLAQPYAERTDKNNQQPNPWANYTEAFFLLGLTCISAVQRVEDDTARNSITIVILVLMYGPALIYYVYISIRFVRYRITKYGCCALGDNPQSQQSSPTATPKVDRKDITNIIMSKY